MHDGYDPWRQDFNIALTDLGKSLNVKLNQTKYKLKVISSPPGSEVLVGNIPVGGACDDGGVLVVVAVLSLCHALCPAAAAQTTTPNLQHTKNTPDLGLRGTLTVDPSTLGMSIGIPLGGYQGRAGTGKELGLHYNLKVWRVEYDDPLTGT
jgi:hypothetical protein